MVVIHFPHRGMCSLSPDPTLTSVPSVQGTPTLNCLVTGHGGSALCLASLLSHPGSHWQQPNGPLTVSHITIKPSTDCHSRLFQFGFSGDGGGEWEAQNPPFIEQGVMQTPQAGLDPAGLSLSQSSWWLVVATSW